MNEADETQISGIDEYKNRKTTLLSIVKLCHI